MKSPHALSALLLLPLATSCATTMAPAPVPHDDGGTDVSNVHFHIGERSFDDGWGAVEDQQVFGVTYDTYDPHEFLGFEMSGFFSGSVEDDVPIDGKTYEVAGASTELAVGIRKTIGGPHNRMRPYLGAGLSYIGGFIDTENERDRHDDERIDDQGTGIYAHAGFYWMVNSNFMVGADYRVLRNADFEEDSRFGFAFDDANYDQVTLNLGFGF